MQGRISQDPSGPFAGQAGPRGLRQGDRREGESGKGGRMDELVACFITFSPRATYSALERCVRTHLVGNAEAASAGYDDKGEAGKAFSASENSP